MNLNNIHGPRPKNKCGPPYFPDSTIALCKKDVLVVLSMFPKRLLKLLRKSLERKQVDGAFAHSDLIGTLVRLKSGIRNHATNRRRCYETVIERQPGLHNDFEYWFAQIGGKPSLGSQAKVYRSEFSRLTIEWCKEEIRRPRRRRKSQSA